MSSVKSLLIIIVFLLIALTASLFLVFRTTIFSGRATNVNQAPVTLENSYLFASPLQAKADGQERIRITIFVLDGRGLGVANQLIALNYSSDLKVTNIQPTSDDTGKAIFDISSTKTGTFEISAKIGNKTIPQTVKINFF